MRAFLIACAGIVVIALIAFIGTSNAQRMSGAAYTTEGARIKQTWSARRLFAKAGPTGGGGLHMAGEADGLSENCEISSTWRWILVDFSDSAYEAPECH